jgi:Ran GTPase-activating protein (RanGAP) involved in mRNA processing and transport
MAIVQIPTTFERLYRLALPNNSIADQGVQFLLKKRLQYLEILDLSKNNLTVKGARIIS